MRCEFAKAGNYGARDSRGFEMKPEELEEYEERAAIIEFCGNVPREQAEALAKEQINNSSSQQQGAYRFEMIGD